MEEITEYRQELLSKLAGGVDELSGIVTSIPANAWHVLIAPDTHPPHYILAHLVELETSLFAAHLHRIYNENSPILSILEDDHRMMERYDPQRPVQELLEVFSDSREQEVGWLRSLSPQEWSCSARHPWWGLRTLQWWAERQVGVTNWHVKALSAFSAA